MQPSLAIYGACPTPGPDVAVSHPPLPGDLASTHQRQTHKQDAAARRERKQDDSAHCVRALVHEVEVTKSKQLSPLPLEWESLCELVGYCAAYFISTRLSEYVTALGLRALDPPEVTAYFYKSAFTVRGLAGRDGFTLRVTPNWNPPSACSGAMRRVLEASRHTGVPALRQSVWFKRVATQLLPESGEVVVALCVQGIAGAVDAEGQHLAVVDFLLVQPHVPCLPKAGQKPTRLGLNVCEVPPAMVDDAAAANAYLHTHGSKVLCGGSQRVAIDSYHPTVHADEVCLGSGADMIFLSPSQITGVADIVPVFVPGKSPERVVREPALGWEALNASRPPLLRAYPRS